MNRFVYANPKLCIGCDTCLAACADVHEAAGLQAQHRLVIARSGTISEPITCRHCENSPCVTVCPVNAVKVVDNHIVLDEKVCNGCKLCVNVCPFGVISFSDDVVNNSLEKQPVAVKCDLCDFSKDGPECVRACPTNALFLLDVKTLRKSGTAKRKAAVENMPPFIMGDAKK